MVRYQADDPAWLETPYLTLAVRFSSTIGGFIGVYAIIYLIVNYIAGSRPIGGSRSRWFLTSA
jgi:hypothetical protein